jgi:ABC-type xylose transport system permease subunit
LGGAERKGAWEPPARLDVIAIMGGVELDFTEADLLEGETVVEVLAIMGGVKIIVPGDIDIESGSGLGIMGGFASVSHRADSDDDPPLLRIRGVALMGGVEIKFK